jgi:effector-binding domain-containing protein
MTAKMYDDLIFNQIGGYTLPNVVLSAIKVLCDEIGYTGSTQQNTYVNQYNANAMAAEKSQKPKDNGEWNGGSKIHRKTGGSNNNRNGSVGSNGSNTDWKIKSGFALTKFAALDNSQQLLGEIRTDMNKLSEKNLVAKLETLKKHVNEIMDSSDSDNDSNGDNEQPTNKITKIMDVIYTSSVNNKLPLLYSRAYETVYEMYPEEVAAFIEDKLKKHADSMENIIDVSEKDYDKFCEFNLENNIRKNFTTLLCEIAKQGKISTVPVIRMTGILSNLLEQVLAKINHKIKQKEVEEITENIVLIFASLGKIIEKEKYLPTIQTIVGYKSGEKPGLSSRTKFKYMDLANL